VCDTCRGIAGGEDVDVLEIDGASNRRIDEVRDIRSNVQYRPSRARYKIYIIDEVHMLTKEAFNALLKTLEEPPPHVKFIFATTEAEKVPITILSRCQRFDFPGIPLPRNVEHLRAVAEREGLRADDEALELVARRAGGSLRDAQSLLDQVLAFGGDRLTADQVHHLLGTAGDERVLALAEAALAGEPKQALDLLDDACVAGLQLGELLDQLISYWRDLMVVHCAGTEGRDLSVPARHRDTLGRQAQGLKLDTILAGLDVLSATRARLRGSNHGRTLVEMALVRLGRLPNLVSLTRLTQWLGQHPAGLGNAGAAGPAAAAGVPRVAPPEGLKKKDLSPAPDGQGAADGPVALTPETLPEVWARVLGAVNSSFVVHQVKMAGIPAISGPNTLVLTFPAAYNQAREDCEDPTRLLRVEEALRKVTGRAWTLRVETTNAGPTPPAGAVPEATPPPRPRPNSREEAEKHPLIKRALEVLGATVHRVEEGFGEAAGHPGPAPLPAEEEL
jgi:DNA polymerase-3 subunit gamma/tau